MDAWPNRRRLGVWAAPVVSIKQRFCASDRRTQERWSVGLPGGHGVSELQCIPIIIVQESAATLSLSLHPHVFPKGVGGIGLWIQWRFASREWDFMVEESLQIKKHTLQLESTVYRGTTAAETDLISSFSRRVWPLWTQIWMSSRTPLWATVNTRCSVYFSPGFTDPHLFWALLPWLWSDWISLRYLEFQELSESSPDTCPQPWVLHYGSSLVSKAVAVLWSVMSRSLTAMFHRLNSDWEESFNRTRRTLQNSAHW